MFLVNFFSQCSLANKLYLVISKSLPILNLLSQISKVFLKVRSEQFWIYKKIFTIGPFAYCPHQITSFSQLQSQEKMTSRYECVLLVSCSQKEKNTKISHPWLKKVLTIVELFTLAAEMFGVGDFWLEIRVIIKILSHP